jgi:hypothetical protein
VYSQIWLNLLVEDHPFGYIAKSAKKKILDGWGGGDNYHSMVNMVIRGVSVPFFFWEE